MDPHILTSQWFGHHSLLRKQGGKVLIPEGSSVCSVSCIYLGLPDTLEMFGMY